MCDVRAPFIPPPPPPVRLHYIAANAIRGTTWGSLPPFPANQSSLLNTADPSDATRLSGHAHVRAHGHPPPGELLRYDEDVRIQEENLLMLQMDGMEKGRT